MIPARIVLGGDSAGAQIASQLAAVQTDRRPGRARWGCPPRCRRGTLRGVVLFCGIYDMSTVGGTGFPALRTYLWAYTGTRELDVVSGDQPAVDHPARHLRSTRRPSCRTETPIRSGPRPRSSRPP